MNGAGTYLQVSSVGMIDPNNGNAAFASVGPDAGDIWAPSLVTVTTQPNPNITKPLQSYCVLYRGSVPNQGTGVQQSNFIDDTYLGRGDASSILAGTLVQYGEAITAVWETVNSVIPAFYTASLTVYGRSFPTMQDVQGELSPTPGTRFSGSIGNALNWDIIQASAPASTQAVDNAQLFSITDNQSELTALQYQITTSAVAGNRIFGLACVYNGLNLIRVFSGLVHPPSTTIIYHFGAGEGAYNQPSLGAGISGASGIQLPAKTLLPITSTIVFRGLNIQAGDNISGVQVDTRQYRTSSKAGYL